MARPKIRRRKPRAPVHFAGRGWTWDQLCQGLIVYGGIGSGKSYSTESLLEQLIAAGTPMLVTSVKPDEFRRYVKICTKLGCLDRLVLINDKNGHCINFLDEILKTSSPADAASFIIDMGSAGGGDHNGVNEAFWNNMAHGAYRYAIRLAEMAYGQVSVQAVYDIIRSAPDSPDKAKTAEYSTVKLHPDAKAYAKAMYRVEVLNNPDHIGDFNRIQSYFCAEMCSTDKIYGSVISLVMGSLGRFVDQPWAGLLNTTTLTPTIIQEKKLVAVIDMAVMRYHQPARLFNSMWVQMTQRYLMQRDASGFEQPFVIVRDEVGWVLSAEWDAKAHNVLRSQRACSIAICQCIDTLEAALGGNTKQHHEAMAFSSQHMHKLAFQNYSQLTNDWFSAIGGQYKEIMVSSGNHQIEGDVYAEAMGCKSHGWNMQYAPVVRPEAFTRLATGCAYLFSGGRVEYVDLRRKS